MNAKKLPRRSRKRLCTLAVYSRNSVKQQCLQYAVYVTNRHSYLILYIVLQTCTVLETLADVIEIKDISLLSLELEVLFLFCAKVRIVSYDFGF